MENKKREPLNSIKVFAEQEVYYKVNHTILIKDGKFILRNTYTGQEEEISKDEAERLKEDWKED